MRTLILLACIACILYQVGAFTCPLNCEGVKCDKDLSSCKYGTLRDVCNCCDVCAKGLGEDCGGIWGRSGRCASGLKCQPHPTEKVRPGKCVPK